MHNQKLLILNEFIDFKNLQKVYKPLFRIFKLYES